MPPKHMFKGLTLTVLTMNLGPQDASLVIAVETELMFELVLSRHACALAAHVKVISTKFSTFCDRKQRDLQCVLRLLIILYT